MNSQKHFSIFFCVVFFFLGIYFCYYSVKYPDAFIEGFENDSDLSCPNILVQTGNEIFLYNSKKVNVPGVNPIKFQHLDDYVEFMEWQKAQNINCPVLYLQHSFDANGFDSYRVRPNILEPEPGLNPEFVAKEDIIPVVDGSNNFNLVDPMKDEWLGPEYTESRVLAGDFSGNYIPQNP
jgi:hypothetical protein